MKKILILLGIFTSSVILFGSDNNNDEATVNITAEFLAPIKIITTDASFGTIIAGSQTEATTNSTNAGAHNGALEIEADRDVFIAWKSGSSGSFKSAQIPLDVILTHSDKSKTISSKFHTSYKGKDNVDSFNPALSKDKLEVVGKLEVPNSVQTGSYSGTITFRVTYINEYPSN